MMRMFVDYIELECELEQPPYLNNVLYGLRILPVNNDEIIRHRFGVNLVDKIN